MAFTLVKSVLIVPALASGLWMVKEGPPLQKAALPFAIAQSSTKPVSEAETDNVSSSDASQPANSSQAKGETARESEIINRRLRIERILVTLDEVAEVAIQMNPEQAVSLEPVLVDLAEQTLELTSEDAVQSSSTDGELEEIETTVDRLVSVVERMVEPEMSL